MASIRPSSARTTHANLAAGARDGSEAARRHGGYLARHAVGHLLVLGDAAGAAALLRQFDFLSAFVDESRNRLDRPWACCRLVGADMLRAQWENALEAPLVASSRSWHLWALLGDFFTTVGLRTLAVRAYAFARESLEAEGVTDRALASVETRVGKHLLEDGRPEEALPHAIRARDLRLSFYGADDALTLRADNLVASCHLALGDLVTAEALFFATHAHQVRILGETHFDTLVTLGDIGLVQTRRGQHEDALGALRAAAAGLTRIAPHGAASLRVKNTLAGCLQDLDQRDEAVALYEELRATFARRWGEAHWDTVTVVNNLSTLYGQLGRLEEAVAAMRCAVRGAMELFPPDHPHLVRMRVNLGTALRSTGALDEADAVFARVWEDAVSAFALGDSRRRRVATRRASLALQRGRPSNTLCAEALLSLQASPPDETAFLEANALAADLLDGGDAAGAEPFYAYCVRAQPDPEDWRHLWARLGQALCTCAGTGDPAAALPHLDALANVVGPGDERVTRARARVERVCTPRPS